MSLAQLAVILLHSGKLTSSEGVEREHDPHSCSALSHLHLAISQLIHSYCSTSSLYYTFQMFFFQHAGTHPTKGRRNYFRRGSVSREGKIPEQYTQVKVEHEWWAGEHWSEKVQNVKASSHKILALNRFLRGLFPCHLPFIDKLGRQVFPPCYNRWGLPTLTWEIPVHLGVETWEGRVWGGKEVQQGYDSIESTLRNGHFLQVNWFLQSGDH